MVLIFDFLGSYTKTRWDMKHLRSRAQLEKVQQRRLQRLLKWLPADHYYSAYKNGPWSQIPISDKAHWMGNFNQVNTLGLDFDQTRNFARHQEDTRQFDDEIRPGISVGLSTGTSGNQGVFITSQRERGLWAGAIIGKLLPKIPKQQERVAFFMRANNNLYESTGSRFLKFKFFDLMRDPQKNLVDLVPFDATILIAPPTMLLEIVRYYQEHKLDFSFKKIISIAETLEPEDKNWLEKETGQIIHQVYQATEGFLGATCPYGTLHLNEDNLLVEKDVIDEEQHLFAPIITDFYRHSQPLIRYRLNDVLQEKVTPCPCGSPYLALERIIGREDDLLIFAQENSQGSQKVFPDFLRKVVLEANANIQNYQIIQQDPHHLTIALEDEAYQKAVMDNLIKFLQTHHLEVPAVNFVAYHYDFKNGKRRKIIREKQKGKV
ncbi:F390 synthetase-related protein [Convivina intestini]|uniref:Putative adenylate-forming enzyme n=1 Tax=Convivina intestini TaxID=1505726 RepID=A0A2U1DFC5_9LACO|nr:F390 synthetase-related protein [Convivina intestini]PVY86364.1 putative adenylate-forming enzyme [Convivina intestini]CAH1850653.1 hypothetical protein R077811_00134 [Convivina intestini]SDB82936.1 putative adenylate-forming enzyme [Leuconostocaceae bacterium R-53105]